MLKRVKDALLLGAKRAEPGFEIARERALGQSGKDVLTGASDRCLGQHGACGIPGREEIPPSFRTYEQCFVKMDITGVASVSCCPQAPGWPTQRINPTAVNAENLRFQGSEAIKF